VSPTDAEKTYPRKSRGMLRWRLRNYSDGKIVATRGIGLTDLLHEGGGAPPASTLPVMRIQPAPALTARPAHGPTGFRIEVMRDGKSSEAMQFVHSGTASHSSFQANQDTPAVAEPPTIPAAPTMPEAPEAPEGPVSSAKPVWSRELRCTAAECISPRFEEMKLKDSRCRMARRSGRVIPATCRRQKTYQVP